MIEWGMPAALWGLAAVAGVALVSAVLGRRRTRRMRALLEPEAEAVLQPGPEATAPRARAVLRFAALALIVLAAARPRWGEDWIEVERRGLDVMVLLDVSNSMRADDFRPSRLQQARWGLRDLLPHLRGDRLGLTIFAGDAQVLCPLTIDHGMFRMMLDDAAPELVARGGTAIARALRVAMDALEPPTEADRVILLVSDGEDHEEDPRNLVDELRAREIRLFAVGIGDPRGSPIPIGDPARGEGGFLRDREGRVVQTRLDEQLLQDLAMRTGGGYVRAVPGDLGVERLYREAMADLRRAQHEARRIREPRERFGWALGAAMLALAAEFGLLLRRRRSRNAGSASPSAAAAAGLLLFLLVGAVRAESPRTRMDEGLRAYDREDWEAAAAAFARAAERAPESGLDPARALHNAGLALVRAGRHAEAASLFEAAGRTIDSAVQARAHFGRGFSLAAEAERQVAGGAVDEARETLAEAIAAYEQALRIDPQDTDARTNFELARRRLDELPEEPPEPSTEPDPGEPDPPEEEPEPADPEPPAEDPEPGEPDPSDPEDPGENGPEPEEPQPEGAEPAEHPPELSESDALQLLDALRDQEAAHRTEARRPRPDPVPVERDW